MLDELRSALAAYPRSYGYYLVKMVALDARWREDEETALTAAFQALDDHEWPAPELRPNDQTWADYEVIERRARELTVDALVGGAAVGHARDTIDRQEALALWLRFRGLFAPQARFFCGVGFGDSNYVFSGGAVIVDDVKAGCLFIIEND
ncbi:hypothetical protein WMF30_13925 [Sorangium sp. So ce134]